MHIDVSLSPFDATWEQLADAAVLADELGVAGVWMMDHLTGTVHDRAHVLECFTVLGGLAALTSRVRLGTLVVNAAVRHVALLAQSAATLQEQSRGRFVLGIGAGGGSGTAYANEMEVIGVGDEAAAVRRKRVTETIEALAHTWSAATHSFEGDHAYVGSAAGFLRPDPAPPLVIAGSGPRMARLAGEVADGFNTSATSPDLDRLLDAVRIAAADAGRPPVEASVYADDDPAWLDPTSARRRRLERAGVDRLILTLPPPFDPELLRAVADA